MKRIKQSGGIVCDQSGRILMVKAVSNMWTFPKGKVEAGEGLIAAARREVKEETGVIEIELIKKLGSYERLGFTEENTVTPSVIKHITFYLFRTKQQDLTVNDSGTLAAEWVNLAKVARRLSHEKDREFFLSQRGAIRF